MQSIHTLRGLALGGIASIALAATAQANQIANGGFETPVIAAASFQNITPGTEPAGFNWTVTTNNVDLFSNGVLGTGTATVYEGNQALDLVGTGSTGGIAQSFATIAGQTYLLSFAFANNPISTGGLGGAANVVVNDGAGILLDTSVSHNSSTGSDFDWTQFSQTFVATGTTATLTFITTVGGSNGGIFLDAVSIEAYTRPPPTEVPEPASLALLGLGLAALGGASRRRATRR